MDPKTPSQFINNLRRISGVVTVENVFNLPIGQTLYVFINTQKNLILVEGTILDISHHEVDNKPDVLITMEFIIKDKPHPSTLVIGQTYNGWTDLLGGEGDNLNRVFTSKDSAIGYFENVSYLNDIKSLERSRSVHGLISRLLQQSNGQKYTGGDPSDPYKKKD